MSTTARLRFYRYHDEVGVAVFDLADGHAIWVDATLVDEDLGHNEHGVDRTWTLADALHRFRPSRIAIAYGDLYTDMATPLGMQALAWMSDAADLDPVGTSILAVGTDCRTDRERAADELKARR
jgi:hypothetical protein